MSERFIDLIYGKEFTNSVIILKILSIMIIFMFLIRPLSRMLVAVEKQKALMKISFFTAILNIILNLIFYFLVTN